MKNTDPHQKCSSNQPPAIGSGGDGDAAGRAPDADRLGPLARIAEHVGEDRQRGREDQRRTDTHEAPSRRSVRSPSRRSRRRPTSRANTTRPIANAFLRPYSIAQTAGRQQQPGEHEEVCVDDPLELTSGCAQVDDERWQGDVDDRAVEHRDEHGEAHHGEYGPPARVAELAQNLGAGAARADADLGRSRADRAASGTPECDLSNGKFGRYGGAWTTSRSIGRM